jgi:hypothetical protein
MKILALIFLCTNLCANDLRLFYSLDSISSSLTNTAIELYATSNFKNWKFVATFTNSMQVSATNQFIKARVRPPPPVIVISQHCTGTSARIFGTSTRPISKLWLTNGCSTVEGTMTRQYLDNFSSSVCDWEFPIFSTEGGAAYLKFVDIDRNIVTTNTEIFCTQDVPITTEFPTSGLSVVGNRIPVSGSVDRMNSLVWVNTGTAVYMATVRNGKFITEDIPIALSNYWSIHCISDYYGETVETVSFTKSQVTTTYTVENFTQFYGERGIVVSGTISDASYDIVIGTNRITTVNGTWRARIIPPEKGLLRFRVIPKSQSVVYNPSHDGLWAMDYPSFSYASAQTLSINYYSAAVSRTAMSSFNGWDKTNRVFSRIVDRHRDCSVTYSGIGEYLPLIEEVGPGCSAPPDRALYPSKYIGNLCDDGVSADSLGIAGSSVSRFNVGGVPSDDRYHKVTVDLALFRVSARYEDEVWFSEQPVSSKGWKIGGQECPWVFTAHSQLEFDCTPTMPVMDTDFYYYEVVVSKEPIPTP